MPYLCQFYNFHSRQHTIKLLDCCDNIDQGFLKRNECKFNLLVLCSVSTFKTTNDYG